MPADPFPVVIPPMRKRKGIERAGGVIANALFEPEEGQSTSIKEAAYAPHPVIDKPSVSLYSSPLFGL